MEKKYSILLILFLFLFQKINSQFVTNDLELMNLRGSVKYLKEHNHKPASNQNDSITIGSRVNSGNNDISFNERGQIIMQGVLKLDDSYYGTLQYKYDSHNRVLEEVETGGKKVVFKYDSIHLTKEENVFQDDKLIYKIIFKYNEEKKIMEKKGIKYPSKEINEHILYDYDKNGNLIQQKSIINTVLTINNFYNKTNQLIKSISSNKNGLPSMKIEYLYDKNGKLESQKYFYDEKLNLGLLKEYNFNKDITKEIGYRYTDQSVEFEYEYSYEYDKNNNWRKLIKFRNKIPIEIKFRQIEYY